MRTRACKRDVVAGYGNAVPPSCAEILVSALTEAVTGETLNPANAQP